MIIKRYRKSRQRDTTNKRERKFGQKERNHYPIRTDKDVDRNNSNNPTSICHQNTVIVITCQLLQKRKKKFQKEAVINKERIQKWKQRDVYEEL